MIRVLLCDDHRIVREGLRQVLADDADIMVCGEARTGTEALAQVQALMGAAPQGDRTGLDVVLLDIAMPERDGLDVLQVIRREYPGLPVLMLSTYPEKQYAVRCIQLGAAGYLHKSADPDDMVAAVRKVAGGGRYLTDATAEAAGAQHGQHLPYAHSRKDRRAQRCGAGPAGRTAGACGRAVVLSTGVCRAGPTACRANGHEMPGRWLHGAKLARHLRSRCINFAEVRHVRVFLPLRR